MPQLARVAPLLSVLACAAGAAQETAVHVVAGRPLIEATLHAGETSYRCHLLLDLARTAPLFLHANAARALGARTVTLRSGDLELGGLPVDGARDTWLEGFTARHATALREVPLAGYLGLGALLDHTIELDGPGRTLRLRGAAAGTTRPESGAADLLGEPARDGLRVAAVGADGRTVPLTLDPREDASFLPPADAARLGAERGIARSLRVGELDLARWTPFRPERSPSGRGATLGGRLLARLVTTAAPRHGWIAFAAEGEPELPADETAYVAAGLADDPAAALHAYLAAHPGGEFRADAGDRLLELAARAGDLAAIAAAVLARVEAAPADGKGRAALAVLDALPAAAEWHELRRQVAEAALVDARRDQDGGAVHRLRLELGRLAQARGDDREAYRHLLAAVFGMPGDGAANLALGTLHERRGELERARSRYLLALLDAEATGEDGLLALRRVDRELDGEAGFAVRLAELADGRVPALHPIPREPEEVAPTGRVVLCELFTGAQCPPCAAADVAFDALGELFTPAEVALVQWHLPIPRPEPMVAAIARDRARELGITGTPTAVFGGVERVAGGGRADRATELFATYRHEVEEALRDPPPFALRGALAIDGDAITAEVRAEGELPAAAVHAVVVERTIVFPGSNGILFHHAVARGALTPAAGVDLASCAGGRRLAGSIAAIELDLDVAVAALEDGGRFAIRPTTLDRGALAVVVFAAAPDGTVLQATTLTQSER